MNVDQAVGLLYRLAGENRNSPLYLEALEALRVIEQSCVALDSAKRIMELHLQGNFDKDLHGVMEHTCICQIRLLAPHAR